MRHLKRGLGFVALAGAVAFAIPAVATEWVSDYATGPITASGCTTTGLTNEACQMMIVSGGQTVLVRAYSTRTADHLSSGQWRSADIALYGGGFGVTNQVDANEGISPEHAVDNDQAYDMLVFELPASGFDIEGFKLGWAQESGIYGSADVQAWVGGNALASSFNFSNACFSGCTNSGTTAGTLASLGFTDVTSKMRNSGTNSLIYGSDVPVGATITFDGTNSGKYLVVSGRLGDSKDAFKVDVIKGTGTVPAPGTLALLGLGLFGLVTLKRRPAFA